MQRGQQLSPVFEERGEMNLILSRNHLEFSLFWNHFKVGRPTWLPLTSWRVIEKNIWNYVVSMYLISDITVSTPAWPYGSPGRASFESNNFSGNEIIFPIYLWERWANRAHWRSEHKQHYNIYISPFCPAIILRPESGSINNILFGLSAFFTLIVKHNQKSQWKVTSAEGCFFVL